VLNTKPQHSNSNNSQTQSQPTPKPLRIDLKKSDYPNVKHWERRKNNPMQLSVIRVYDADSSDSDSNRESNDDKGIPKRGSGVLAFLEDKNGKVIGCCERKQLYAEMQGFWNNNIDSACPSGNWSSAGSTLRDSFQDTLEDKFPFLHLCAGRWKVDELWKKNYHSWKQFLLARQAKKTALDAGGSNDGSKCKCKESLGPMDPDAKADESLDMP